jgi:hypothetical protein
MIELGGAEIPLRDLAASLPPTILRHDSRNEVFARARAHCVNDCEAYAPKSRWPREGLASQRSRER